MFYQNYPNEAQSDKSATALEETENSYEITVEDFTHDFSELDPNDLTSFENLQPIKRDNYDEFSNPIVNQEDYNTFDNVKTINKDVYENHNLSENAAVDQSYNNELEYHNRHIDNQFQDSYKEKSDAEPFSESKHENPEHFMNQDFEYAIANDKDIDDVGEQDQSESSIKLEQRFPNSLILDDTFNQSKIASFEKHTDHFDDIEFYASVNHSSEDDFLNGVVTEKETIKNDTAKNGAIDDFHATEDLTDEPVNASISVMQASGQSIDASGITGTYEKGIIYNIHGPCN